MHVLQHCFPATTTFDQTSTRGHNPWCATRARRLHACTVANSRSAQHNPVPRNRALDSGGSPQVPPSLVWNVSWKRCDFFREGIVARLFLSNLTVMPSRADSSTSYRLRVSFTFSPCFEIDYDDVDSTFWASTSACQLCPLRPIHGALSALVKSRVV